MAEKYLAYPEYKNTDSEWVSEIPVHWEPILFKRVITQIKDGTHGTHARVSEGFPFLSAKNVLHKGVEISDSESMVSEKDYKEITANGFPKKGDLLITCVGTIGRTCVYEFDKPYAFQRSVAFLRLSDLAEPKFYKYFVESKNYQSQLAANSKASAQSGVYMGDLVSTSAVLLPKDEQKTIANFLDHETAQIDTLIEKQQTLIQLLKEKRQAVISHAVTKGLNPDVPMKDSDVEWLGEVPDHWVVTKFSHCAQIRNGLVDPKAPDFKNLVLYAPNHIEKGTGKIVYKETAEEQGADSSKYLCYKGEVIYSKIRPALAKVAICEEETALCSADMYPINAVNGLDNRFLYFFMLSDNFTKAAILDSDRVAMPKINRESLSDYRLPVPPVIEQMAICKFIANQNTKLEELESKATKAIQLMQERRTALISAAVTGKIDVRGWVAPDSK